MINNNKLRSILILGFPVSWWIVLFLALCLRVVLLDASFWMDEAAQVLQSVRPLHQQHLISADFQPPLLHYLTHFMSTLSVDETWLRFVPLFAGLGTIWFSFLLSRELKLAPDWLAGLFLAISPFHILFSQELRPYSLAAFFTVGSWYFVLKVQKKASVQNWAGVAIFNLLSWYSMYVSVFYSVVQVLYLFVCVPKSRTAVINAFGLASLLYLPWLPFLFEQFRVASTLTDTLPGWSSIVGNVPWKSLGLVGARFFYGIDPIDATQTTFMKLSGVIFFILVFMVAFLLNRAKKISHSRLEFLMWSSIVPIGVVWIVSFLLPILQPKRVMASQIGLAIFLPILLELASRMKVRFYNSLAWFSILLLFMIQFFGVWQYWSDVTLQRERWREVVIELHEQFSVEQTVVVFGFTAPFSSWELYSSQLNLEFSTVSFETIPISSNSLETSMQRVRSYNRVLVLDYLRDVTDPSRSIESWLESNGYAGVASYDTVNFGFIRVYELQSTDIQAIRLQ